jgi:DHA2 family multidrug resistance protein
MNRIPVRVQLSLGLGCMGLSMFLQAGMTPDTNLWVIISWTLIRSVGMALSFPAMNQSALGAVPIQKIGMASGLFNVTRQVGGTFAIAAFATLLTQRQVFHMAILGQDVAHNGVAARMIPGMAQWLVSHGSAPWMARMQAGAMMAMTTGKQAMVYAFQDVFWVAGIVSLLGIVPAMMMSKPPQTQGAPGGAGHQPMMAE